MTASTRFVYYRTIKTVEERFVVRHVSGVGKDAKMGQVSIGWYATFVEDPVAAYLGTAPVGLAAGDKMQFVLERVGPSRVVALPVAEKGEAT